VDLWALDEVHFQQYGSRCRMWIPPEEKDPVLRHFPGRKSVGYFGAVRLRDGEFVYQREDEKFNAVTFHEFMKKLHACGSVPGRRMIIISDNAKYHHAKLHKSWRDEHAEVFDLNFLPPYSPDLNPAERIWKLTRRNVIHNRYFPNIRNVATVVEGQFDLWAAPNETLRRLCAIN
jgi:transposase